MSSPASPHVFATTRWSLVVNAGRFGEQGAEALAELCQRHWYRELLRAEVAQAVAEPSQVDDELRGLHKSLG